MKLLLQLLIAILLLISCQAKKGDYVCPPCDMSCDQLTFEEAGICPHCNMTLIKKSERDAELNLVLNEVKLATGSGVFLIEDLKGKEDKSIKVYYHKPLNFTDNSRILLVIPGAGRNANDYRDAWTEKAEKYSVLILSPMFEEEKYPFEDYHLCGLMKDINLEESIGYVDGTNQVMLNDTVLSFSINNDPNEWLFNDFDRIFDLVMESENTGQTNYDIFGHSAGGQILHRMALLYQNSKASKLIAANSGFYTLPDPNTNLPFGLKGLNSNATTLANAFSTQLILLVGELDNEKETKGTLLRSDVADIQGTHRLARAKYFLEYAHVKADALEADFNWEITIIPAVGHDHILMGDAAAKILYE